MKISRLLMTESYSTITKSSVGAPPTFVIQPHLHLQINNRPPLVLLRVNTVPQACRLFIAMVELSWSQTPSSVWWALETGTGASNLSLDNILSSPTPTKKASVGKRTLQRQLTSPTLFYNSLDETDFGEQEQDLEHWMSEDPNRGVIRLVSVMKLNKYRSFMHIHNTNKLH